MTDLDRLKALASEDARRPGLRAVFILMMLFSVISMLTALGSLLYAYNVANEDARQANVDKDATLRAIRTACEDPKLPRDLSFMCDQADQIEAQPGPDDPEVQDPEVNDPEIQEPEVQEPERQELEAQDREVQDPERDDDESQDVEVDDPEIQDPEVDDPDPDDPEAQDPEPNDPQDPPETYTFNGPGVSWRCTRDEGSDPRNPTYTCS